VDDLLFIPGPVMVPEEVRMEAARSMINHRSARFRAMFKETLEKLGAVLSLSESKAVILTASGTGAVEALAANLAPGRRTLVLQTGEFSQRLGETLEIHGAHVTRVSAPLGEAPPIGEVEEAIEAIKPEVVAVVYNDTSPGVRLSYIREVCEKAKSEGALTIVDAVSAVGGDELEVEKWGIDAMAGASQKCISAPPGISFVTLSSEAERMLVEKPRTFYLDLRRYIKYLERFETPFTPAIPLLYAFNRALTRLLEFGVERWIRLHALRAEALYAAFGHLGLTPFVAPQYRSRTVLTFTGPEGLDLSGLRSRLAEKHGIYVAGGLGELRDSILRIGNMGYIRFRDLVTLVSATAVELAGMGLSPRVEEALREIDRPGLNNV